MAIVDHTDIETALTLLATAVSDMAPSAGVRFAQKAQREFAAIETRHLAALNERDRRRASSAGGTRSRKETLKASKRSETVAHNASLATKLAAGHIGTEQLDAIAHATEKSGGEAASDSKLISDIESSKPDDAQKVAQRWLEQRETNAAQTRYDRQNQQRKAVAGHDPITGCATLTLTGPEERIANLKRRVEQRANDLYQADGGRDLPHHEHPRTHHQRCFDAAEEIILNTTTTNDNGNGNDNGNSNSNGDTNTRVSAPHPKAMIHVSLIVDDTAASEIRATCPDGSGYLPESVLERYDCESVIAGTVYNESGDVLWFGRQRRYATPAQFAALIARDGGCVLCARNPEFCEAHHLLPYNAPDKGETNISDLALVCKSCHPWLHDTKRTLIWTNAPPNDPPDERAGPNQPPKRIWTTRPATPNEIAAHRPTNTKSRTNRAA